MSLKRPLDSTSSDIDIDHSLVDTIHSLVNPYNRCKLTVIRDYYRKFSNEYLTLFLCHLRKLHDYYERVSNMTEYYYYCSYFLYDEDTLEVAVEHIYDSNDYFIGVCVNYNTIFIDYERYYRKPCNISEYPRSLIVDGDYNHLWALKGVSMDVSHNESVVKFVSRVKKIMDSSKNGSHVKRILNIYERRRMKLVFTLLICFKHSRTLSLINGVPPLRKLILKMMVTGYALDKILSNELSKEDMIHITNEMNNPSSRLNKYESIPLNNYKPVPLNKDKVN